MIHYANYSIVTNGDCIKPIFTIQMKCVFVVRRERRQGACVGCAAQHNRQRAARVRISNGHGAREALSAGDRDLVAGSKGVHELAYTRVDDCYQCGKCSAGCPQAERMDVLPNRLFRLVQMGLSERAMTADSIWQCVSCFTCSTRCPKSVDCVGIIDALRSQSIEKGTVSPAAQRTVTFQQVFLQNIRKNGRLNEVDLIKAFKIKGFFQDYNIPFLFKDAMMAPQLMKRGKFHLKGEKVKDREIVERIFRRCMGS